MTKDQAIAAFRQRVHEATQILEDLAREGRIVKDPDGSPQDELEAIRGLRDEMADSLARFIEENWVSFDDLEAQAKAAAAESSDEPPPSSEPTGDDPTVPRMDSAVIAANERKRLAETGEGEGATGEGDTESTDGATEGDGDAETEGAA